MAAATPCMQFPHSPTTLSPKKSPSNDAVLLLRSAFLGTASSSSKLYRTRSFEFNPKQRLSSLSPIPRASSAIFDSSSSDEDFSRKIQDLAFKFQISDENTVGKFNDLEDDGEEVRKEEEEKSLVKSSLMEIQSVEMKAKSLDLPLSLRMIKRKKKQLQENFIEAGESAYCSVKTAFSSMVFIIRELHSYTLQMREILYFEDLQGILTRVQSEMHASFVWLFQQVFSHTPTLMVYVMILLANFTVHSMANSAAIAAVNPPVATVEGREFSYRSNFEFDASSVKSFTVTSSGSKTASVGGINGGGNNGRPVGSGMDGDSWMNNSESILHRPIVPEGVSSGVSTPEDTRRKEEEVEVWNTIVDEASRMQGQVRDEALDYETVQKFVSPVTAKIEADDYVDYFKTELYYQSGVAQEPNNVLLLANYAQFLYLVVHDFDRAEEYFKRATKVEPKDAEAYDKYANFLWQARNDLWAAEETFLEAIEAEPSNSYYAANYAHFLWNTGGEDTCFPLDSPEDEPLDA